MRLHFPRCNSLCVATFRIHTICSCVPAHPNPICLSQGSQGIVCAIIGESGQQTLIATVRGSEFLVASQLSHPPLVSHNSALAFCISLFALRHSVLVSHISLPSPTMKFIMHLRSRTIHYLRRTTRNSLVLYLCTQSNLIAKTCQDNDQPIGVISQKNWWVYGTIEESTVIHILTDRT